MSLKEYTWGQSLIHRDADINWPYHNLIRPQTLMVLEKLYRDPESAGVSDQSILSWLATYLRMRQPTKVIELGTWIGCSCLVMADILATNNTPGILVSIDPAADKRDKAKQYVQEAGLADTVHFISGESCQDHVVSHLRDTAPYEVVYIDSLHGYENMLRELLFYCPGQGIIGEDGIMFLHDASWAAQEWDPTHQGGVRRALEEWIREHNEMQMLVLEPPAWSNPCGIGIIAHKRGKP